MNATRTRFAPARIHDVPFIDESRALVTPDLPPIRSIEDLRL